MLLINETLIKMMKGLKRYIVFITLLKILILMATVYFTQALSQFLGNLFDPQMTVEQLFAAILPVGIVLSVVGSPIFVYLILTQRRRRIV